MRSEWNFPDLSAQPKVRPIVVELKIEATSNAEPVRENEKFCPPVSNAHNDVFEQARKKFFSK